MKKNESVNDAAVKLAAMIQGEPVYTPETAPIGYASTDAVHKEAPNSSRQMVDKNLRARWKAGELSRVKIKRDGGRFEYWYGPSC